MSEFFFWKNDSKMIVNTSFEQTKRNDNFEMKKKINLEKFVKKKMTKKVKKSQVFFLG